MPDVRGPSNPKNGAPHPAMGALAVADGAAIYDDDPMSKVLGLDAQASSPVAWLGYFLGAFALLLGLMVTARVVTLLMEQLDAQAQPAQIATQEIEVMKDEPPPPAPEETAKPDEPPPVVKPVAHEAPPPPAAAPAQAAKVLAQEPDPNEPVDLTGNTIIQGNADSYAGGTTSGNGTSTRAVRALASPTGVPNGTGTPTVSAPAGPDRSRKASVGATEWNAPFPPEADTAQIDDTYVTIEVDVRADGTASAVRILADPGNGFGREARRYALTQHFQPAFDHDGSPIPSTIKTRVHFSR
jgi:outer membrane biosynthesis protein TonB